MRDLRVFRCVETYPGIAAGRAGRARSNGRPSDDRAGSYGHQRMNSCGLRTALCRSPDETYRLHHNIKASEYQVIGKPESKLSPQANAAGEQAGCGGRAARWAGNAAGRRPAPAKLGGPAMPVRRVGRRCGANAGRRRIAAGLAQLPTASAVRRPSRWIWRVCDVGAVRGLSLGGPAVPEKLSDALALHNVHFRRSDFVVCDADASSPRLLGPFAENGPQI